VTAHVADDYISGALNSVNSSKRGTGPRDRLARGAGGRTRLDANGGVRIASSPAAELGGGAGAVAGRAAEGAAAPIARGEKQREGGFVGRPKSEECIDHGLASESHLGEDGDRCLVWLRHRHDGRQSGK
jgi:hypothetical protein